MKKLIPLLSTLLVFINISASAQFFEWAKKLPGRNVYRGSYVTVGNNVLAVTRDFSDTVVLGNKTLIATKTSSSYLAVFDLSGNLLWSKKIITPNNTSLTKSTFDKQQNLIITGSFRDSLYIDGLIFKGATPSTQGAFILKYSLSGKLLWARSSEISNSQSPSADFLDVTTDSANNVLVTGRFSYSITFGNNYLQGDPSYPNFLVKYNSSGSLAWAKTIDNFQGVSPTIKTSPKGDIFVAASRFGLSVTNTGYNIAKYTATGNQSWINYIPAASVGANYGKLDLAVDNAGNAYISDANFGNLTIGGTTLPPSTGMNNGKYYVAKINNSGSWKWAKVFASYFSPTPPTQYSDWSPKLFYDTENHLIIAGSFSGTAQLGTSTLLGSANSVNTFVAKLDTAGTPIWTNSITSSQPNYPSDISGDQFGNYYLFGNLLNGTAVFGSNTLTSSNETGYLTKIASKENTVSGNVFIDLNKNGLKDINEKAYENLLLTANPSIYQVVSNSNGDYCTYVPTGNSSINIPKIPNYYSAVPTNYPITFNGSNQIQTGKDFALQPIPNQTDVRIKITNFTAARPGFAFKYRITFHNSGTTTLSDTVNIIYDNVKLKYVSSSISPTNQNVGKIAWYYQNLQPNETRNIDITFIIFSSTGIGAKFSAIAKIRPLTADLFVADNYDTTQIITTGSLDPNDKQVNKSIISTTNAAQGEYLDYVIRFQNSGTDTAFTIIVSDKISANLQMNTLEMLSSSHPYVLSLNGNNTLEWRFDNIKLPDSTKNEPGSHGFIRYRMQPKNNLVLGDEIKSRAAIYFDYNVPVITNYAITRVSNITGIKDERTNIQAFKLYPNPARNYVMVEANFNINAASVVSLVNLLGQTISKVNLPANNQIHYQLPLNDLPKGVYLIRLETETGIQTQKLVIQ